MPKSMDKACAKFAKPRNALSKKLKHTPFLPILDGLGRSPNNTLFSKQPAQSASTMVVLHRTAGI